MVAGKTQTGSLADALQTMVASARIVREYEAVVPKTVDRRRLAEGTGLDWIEDRVEALVAQTITENTILDNPQQLQDTKFSITPTMVAIQTIITDRTRRRIVKSVAALLGQAAQRAMERKKDEDGLTQFSNFSTALAGANTTLTSGHVSSAVSQVLGNTTETGMGAGPINLVLHPFGIKDLQDELVSGIGTYTIPIGLSADTYRKGFTGTLFNANVWSAGNMTIDGNSDAQGALYARDALVLVEGHSPRAESRRRPDIGGGADEAFLFDEYAYGERRDVWGISLLHDATAPTS